MCAVDIEPSPVFVISMPYLGESTLIIFSLLKPVESLECLNPILGHIIFLLAQSHGVKEF